MTEHAFKTTLILMRPDGTEHDVPVSVTYTCTPGFKGDHIDPPYAKSIEITEIAVKVEKLTSDFFTTLLCDDADLLAECEEDMCIRLADEADYRREQARDRRLGL
jgi:hypothetical protein